MEVCKIIMFKKRRKQEFCGNHEILFPARFLHLFFPDLVCETAYELFYSRIGQHTSVGNYWNDPHHQVNITSLMILVYYSNYITVYYSEFLVLSESIS